MVGLVVSFLSLLHCLVDISFGFPDILVPNLSLSALYSRLTLRNAGNPRVLLLDEPSTGQDAGAKRILWEAVRSISADRAILLTTHSMEEAEALATNVAILGTEMLAKGTLSSLQMDYGGTFSVRAVRASGVGSCLAMTVIRFEFDDRTVGYTDSHGQISFRLPHEKRMLGKIMGTMEKLKGNVGDERAASEILKVIGDYTITGPTLEKVFMNGAQEVGHSGVV